MPRDVPADNPSPTPSVLNRPRVAAGLGVGVSVLVHVTLIAVGLLLIPPVRQILTGSRVAEQTIVPEAELATKQAGGIPNPGMQNDAGRSAAQDNDTRINPSDAWAARRSASLDRQLMGGSGDVAPAQLGVGGNRAPGRGLARGVTAGGGLAKFGVPGGGSGIGPRGAVFGNGGNAHRIVFVCDGTGTMFDDRKWPLLRDQLDRTAAKLKPTQSYNVIFFHNGERSANESVAAVDKAKLLAATPANRAKADAFLKTFTPGGSTKPLPAVEMAFRMKPQLIYFLSDGAFDDLETYDQVVARFRELNKDKAVRVNTIVFGKTDDASDGLRRAKETMKAIAADNGGTFVAVDPDAVYGRD